MSTRAAATVVGVVVLVAGALVTGAGGASPSSIGPLGGIGRSAGQGTPIRELGERGMLPEEMRRAYGIDRLHESGFRGQGQTVAIMSFDHWLIREFAEQAPGIPAGLTAWGDKEHEIEAHFSMLAHGVSFVSYNVAQLDNRFVRFVRERLGMPVITWTVRDEEAVKATFAHADQMTFEGFEPDVVA